MDKDRIYSGCTKSVIDNHKSKPRVCRRRVEIGTRLCKRHRIQTEKQFPGDVAMKIISRALSLEKARESKRKNRRKR